MCQHLHDYSMHTYVSANAEQFELVSLAVNYV